MSGTLNGGSIRLLWDVSDNATVTITNTTGAPAVFTVDGAAVTFPYTLSASTTFVTAQSGRYEVSVLHHGIEIADTPDSTRMVNVGFGSQEVFAPTPDGVPTAQFTADLHSALGRGVHVTSHDAVGDGVADDTAAFAAAITEAAGAEVFVPDGTYVLANLGIPATADLHLAPGATLRLKGGSEAMLNFTGTQLRVQGGTIDGNKANRGTAWPNILTGAVQEGKSVEFRGVHFTNTVKTAAGYISQFGGTLEVTDCRFTGQAEHTGTQGEYSTIFQVISGEAGGDGLIRFNNNTCIGTDTPAIAGGNPGGIFIAVNGYEAGASGSLGFANGNLSTLEAIGNYFWGYGQNAGGNDISPIHTYPAVGGARVIGNYFEACGFSAISAKSVQNFICTGNTIVNGLYSAQNKASEGAIAYLPGYQASTLSRPRAVISGNIIDTPGGESEAVKQYGITVHGTGDSYATEVVIADNVLNNCGMGIQLDYVDNATLKGNIIKGATGGTAGTEDGIRMNHVTGTLIVSDNQINSRNGMGIRGDGTIDTATVVLTGNVIEHEAVGYWACLVRGAAVAKFSGNLINAPGADAISVSASGGVKTGKFVWDLSNVILDGTISFDFANITQALGHIAYPNAPEGLVSALPGTLYSRTSSGGDTMLYVKTGGSAAVGWLAADGLDDGATTARPTLALYPGRMFFDTTLGKPIYYNGSAWVDATGTAV